jgi:hypothetical protein
MYAKTGQSRSCSHLWNSFILLLSSFLFFIVE